MVRSANVTAKICDLPTSELIAIGETLSEIKIQNVSVIKRLDDIERKQGMNEYFEHFKLRENENQPQMFISPPQTYNSRLLLFYNH